MDPRFTLSDATRTQPRIALRSGRAADRIDAALAWLSRRDPACPLIVVGHTLEAANEIVRHAVGRVGPTFGWHRLTLGKLAGALAAPSLSRAGLLPVGPACVEALMCRVVHRLGAERLGRFAPLAARPGLPRALARTMTELREAALRPSEVKQVELALVLDALTQELATARVADRAEVFRVAAQVAEDASPSPTHELRGVPMLLLDVPVVSVVERRLITALVQSSPAVLATVPAGDESSAAALADCMGPPVDLETPSRSLGRLQAGLFSSTLAVAEASEDVTVFSAPGESRECVEMARAIHREAERGVRFDQMAVVLRSHELYRPHLEEALRRAEVPAYFARGVPRPDPGGRAFMALLGCAADGLSAGRFTEYLSLGQVPSAAAEARGTPAVGEASFVPAEGELLPESTERLAAPLEIGLVSGGELDERASAPAVVSLEEEELAPWAGTPASPPVGAGTPASPSGGADSGAPGDCRWPRLWERLILQASVIGGLARWQRRLDGLASERSRELSAASDPGGPVARRIRLELAALASLRAFALPLLEMLEPLAGWETTWEAWLDVLRKMAVRALADPARVLTVLAGLAPMGSVGPVDLTQVRIVLERRLSDMVIKPSERRYGRLFVGSVDDVRGLAFEVVFVPGMAERLFPQKFTEDAILPDRERVNAAQPLRTNTDRSAAERLLLRIAVGAARRRVVVSFPRIDTEQSRPRTPSFYALEVLRAAEGKLPGFTELARRAEMFASGRLGWPAPSSPSDAIDAAEHDLALLNSLLHRPEVETVGMARYLLGCNKHLARALRFRARRWIRVWTRADGLVDPAPEAREALAAHALSARSYSPTALQNFAVCPYRFVLHALHKLAPREAPGPLSELDPLQRGSLIHETQYELLTELRGAGELPITPERLDAARSRLDRVLDRMAADYAERLAPAIDRVWRDEIDAIRADLREWLRRTCEEREWAPAYFELSFGLPGRRESDPISRDTDVPLECGLRMRGSIDLVERSLRGTLRATDHKSGKPRRANGTIIGGGEALQPVLYALVLEKLFPGERVESGRLYYCTSGAEFADATIALDAKAREAAAMVAKTIGSALERGFLPAAPAAGACTYCDFRCVCGPYEELRTKKMKRQDALKPLNELRGWA